MNLRNMQFSSFPSEEGWYLLLQAVSVAALLPIVFLLRLSLASYPI
jgi:hypothetical protein